MQTKVWRGGEKGETTGLGGDEEREDWRRKRAHEAWCDIVEKRGAGGGVGRRIKT